MGKTQQILSDMRLKMHTGQWQTGYKLPPQRALAEQYHVNRSTIVEVIEELQADGLIETRGRQGTFVVNQSWSLLASERAKYWGVSLEKGLHQANQPIIQAINELEFDVRYTRLGTGELSSELFPKEKMAELMAQTGAEMDALAYEAPKGSLRLRKAISEYLKTVGIEASPECILVVSGSLQALQLISIGLMSSGATLFTEKPSYVKSLNTFQSMGIHLEGVSVGEKGLHLKELLEKYSLLKQEDVALYVIPSFHNPTGRIMSMDERKELLRFCSEYRLPIIEDDAYHELWFESPPPAPLKSLDHNGNVLYLGTMSKTLSPGMRIGWLVGSESVVRKLGDIKMQLDYGASSVSQQLATKWFETGAYTAYMNTLRGQLKRRADLCLKVMETHFKDLGTWEIPKGSFYIWFKLNDSVGANKLFKAALRENLLLNPGEIYDYERNSALRISYAYAKESELEKALITLSQVLRKL